MRKLNWLFAPIKVGNLELKNRIVMAPMGTRFSPDGYLTQQMKDYYVERARGGVGLIIVESCYPCVYRSKNLCLTEEKFVAKLRGLVDAIHETESKVALQMNPYRGVQDEVEPISASDVPSPTGVKPRPITVKEIEMFETKFAEGAERAKRAGFDAIEIHGASGYLIQQFLSPLTNKRTDEYGGDHKRRMRFALEILECTKEKIGRQFPIWFRIPGSEYLEGGITLKDAQVYAKMLEDAGVDAHDITAGHAWIVERLIPPMFFSSGCYVHLAEGIKKVVKKPVMIAGRITDVVLADKIVAEGKADLISMGRALLADPELPKKALEGRIDDIRKCVGCLQGCIDRSRAVMGVERQPVICLQNALVGRERELEIKTTKDPKKVLIVGGGPAGMEAARVCALRGHEVTLLEKNAELGGQLLLACKPPHKQEFQEVIEYLQNQIRKLGVRTELGREVTAELMENLKPDAVIMATGAKPLIPPIPGVDGKNVVTAWDVLAGKVKVGKNVIIVGGGNVGCETAEFLIEKGKNVVIIEMLSEIGGDMGVLLRLLVRRLKERGVKMLTSTRIEKITDKEVVAVKDGERLIFAADTVVLSVGAQSEKKLFEALRGRFSNLFAIGDCVKPRKALEAIQEGLIIAREI